MAKFDGVILDGENPDLIPLINETNKKNIPVVTILSDLPGSSRISYVGINNYRAGFIIGKKMLEKYNDLYEKPRLAVISTDYEKESSTPTSEYLKIFGFREAVSSVADAKIIVWEKTSPQVLNALKTIDNLLASRPDINGIFTTNKLATTATANIMQKKRYNRNVILIGYGDTQKIRNYIHNGIITASVINNPRLIGANAVKEITTYITEKKVNLYSNIHLKILNKSKLKPITQGEIK